MAGCQRPACKIDSAESIHSDGRRGGALPQLSPPPEARPNGLSEGSSANRAGREEQLTRHRRSIAGGRRRRRRPARAWQAHRRTPAFPRLNGENTTVVRWSSTHCASPGISGMATDLLIHGQGQQKRNSWRQIIHLRLAMRVH